jgi:hypothetical protein
VCATGLKLTTSEEKMASQKLVRVIPHSCTITEPSVLSGTKKQKLSKIEMWRLSWILKNPVTDKTFETLSISATLLLA